MKNLCSALFAFLLPIVWTGISPARADLGADYAEIRARAAKLAGEPLDMPKRALLMHEIYRDSLGNHQFPLVALHGALWGSRFFEVTGPIGESISYRYFYDRHERERRKVMLQKFSNAFAETNRSVFIDTYTNYYFTKSHGDELGAEQWIHPELLRALNQVHAASSGKGPKLSDAEKKEIFKTALHFEQELTVGPRIRAAVNEFDCPVMERLALKPVVHFAYFPRRKYFFFHDFSEKKERIARAIDSYDIAKSVGWERVELTMRDYGVIPELR